MEFEYTFVNLNYLNGIRVVKQVQYTLYIDIKAVKVLPRNQYLNLEESVPVQFVWFRNRYLSFLP